MQKLLSAQLSVSPRVPKRPCEKLPGRNLPLAPGLMLFLYPHAEFLGQMPNSFPSETPNIVAVDGTVTLKTGGASSSVGEVKVAETLVNQLRRNKPRTRIHLSVMTKAGYQVAGNALGTTVSLSFLPLDAPFVVRRVLSALDPKLLIITETEIWPTLISQANRRGAKVILVNGRMSSKSVRQYSRVKGLIRSVMQRYTRCFFKTVEDRDRFVLLGLSETKAEVVGDMKFDTTLVPVDSVVLSKIRSKLGIGPDQFLIVAGSTRPGPNGTDNEEEILLQVYTDLKQSHPQTRLVIAPRHLDRVESVARAIEAEGFTVALLDSETADLSSSESDIIVVAYIGGLIQLYQAADIAFVGGTLVPIGGHNLLEPVWAGTPVLFGPSLDNVSEASDHIIANKYGACVSDRTELIGMIESVITDKMKFVRREPDDTTVSATGRVIQWLDGEGLV